MPEQRILNIGEAYMSLTASMQKLPKISEKIESNGDYFFLPGGRGVAFSLASALLGADSVVSTRTGDDYFGMRLAKFLQENKIDIRFITTDKRNDTSFSLVLHEKSGNDSEILYRRASARFCEEDIESSFLSIPDCAIISSELDRGLIKYTSSMCEEKEIPLFFYMSDEDKEMYLDKSSPVTFLYMTAKTCFELTGIAPNSQANCQRASLTLFNMYNIKYSLIHLDNGVFVFDGKYSSFYETPTKEDPVDTEMAGEEFSCAFVFEYLREKDIEKAVKFALYAYGLTSSKSGGIETLVSYDEIQDFIRKCGEEG